MWGQYDSNAGNRYGTPYQYPVWQIMSTERTKWYQSYTPEGQINDMVELMAKDNETYPELIPYFSESLLIPLRARNPLKKKKAINYSIYKLSKKEFGDVFSL